MWATRPESRRLSQRGSRHEMVSDFWCAPPHCWFSTSTEKSPPLSEAGHVRRQDNPAPQARQTIAQRVSVGWSAHKDRVPFRGRHLSAVSQVTPSTVTFSLVAPKGPSAEEPAVQAGYRIAQQNCFRCHNKESEGGTKAGRSWEVLAGKAESSPAYFMAYVHDPHSQNSQAQMPAMPVYDGSTLAVIGAYFRTFAPSHHPAEGQ